MRRRLQLLSAAVLLHACQGGEVAAPSSGRVVAVQAKAGAADPLGEFCDVTARSAEPRQFRMPEVDHGSLPQTRGGVLWLNAWATWCKPCLEEMPRLVGWQKRFSAQGVGLSLVFLSVDETLQGMEAFVKQHPEMPPSLHMKDPSSLESWILQLGLDKGAGLPIHVFVSPDGHVRCVRAAAIDEGQYATVASLLDARDGE